MTESDLIDLNFINYKLFSLIFNNIGINGRRSFKTFNAVYALCTPGALKQPVHLVSDPNLR